MRSRQAAHGRGAATASTTEQLAYGNAGGVALLRGGLPEPELNVVINDSDSGQWLSNSDFVWRREKVVAEFDGDHHRTDRQQWRTAASTVARRENLQDDGWPFVQLTYASVMRYTRNQSTVRRLRRLPGLA